MIDLPVRELERLVLGSPRPCTADPDAWFPDEPDGKRRRAREMYEDRALALCRFCPVVVECLEMTLQREGPAGGHGISGGCAPWTRQQIKKTRGWPVQGGAR